MKKFIKHLFKRLVYGKQFETIETIELSTRITCVHLQDKWNDKTIINVHKTPKL